MQPTDYNQQRAELDADTQNTGDVPTQSVPTDPATPADVPVDASADACAPADTDPSNVQAPEESAQMADEDDKTVEGEQTQHEVGSDQWFEQDSRAFAQSHPQVDCEALFADPDFLDYAEGKVGNTPLGDIYEGYRRLVAHLSAAHARTTAARANSPGSLRQAAPSAEAEFYTLAEMQAMSSAYIEAHWDKVQKSLAHLSK